MTAQTIGMIRDVRILNRTARVVRKLLRPMLHVLTGAIGSIDVTFVLDPVVNACIEKLHNGVFVLKRKRSSRLKWT